MEAPAHRNLGTLVRTRTVSPSNLIFEERIAFGASRKPPRFDELCAEHGKLHARNQSEQLESLQKFNTK
ncbi:MAG TPA: hypothetical protein VGM05_09245 [Planctomycetaceae bacterium]|jgi:hypothetical protein